MGMFLENACRIAASNTKGTTESCPSTMLTFLQCRLICDVVKCNMLLSVVAALLQLVNSGNCALAALLDPWHL